MGTKRFLVLGIALWIVCTGCHDTSQAPSPQAATQTGTALAAADSNWPTPTSHSSASHQRMVRALKDVAARTGDTNVWIGDAKARKLRAQIERLAPNDLPTISRLKSELADAELKLGNEERAIELLTECLEQHLPKVTASWPTRSKRALSNHLTFALAMAHMRLAETQNCCQRNTPDSCIMPIVGEGIHTNQSGSRAAIKYFTQVLRNSENDAKTFLQAQWLINIAYMTVGEYPDGIPKRYLIPPNKLLKGSPFPKFKNVAKSRGIATFSLSGGAIADDFDNDGWLDLVVSTYDTKGQLRFFHNNQDGSFTDRTSEAGLTGITGGLNLVQADYDNDGWTDILVLRGAWQGSQGNHPNSLLRNNGVAGAAQFTDVTFDCGLAKVNYPTQSASWADFDNDGDLDVFIGNEADWMDNNASAAPCQLFRNDAGKFIDIASTAGVLNNRFAKGVVWGDYNNDGFPDLYVSNFLDINRLYNNNGDGTFTDVAPQTQVTGPHASFPAWFWDYNNDGNLDIYASSWTADIFILAAHTLEYDPVAEVAKLYRGDGKGGFIDVAEQVGLTEPTGPMGSNFGDLNGDGFVDFYLGTGEPEFKNLVPNCMFVNDGGQRFKNVTIAGGFGHLQKGHGVVFADLDNDGDQDVFEQMGGAFPGDAFFDALFENPGFGNGWINIKLVGQTSNRSAIGARIRIDTIDSKSQRQTIYRWVNSGGSFGANPLTQNIGLGKATKIERLEVFWPTTGKTQKWTQDVPLNRSIRIVEGNPSLNLG